MITFSSNTHSLDLPEGVSCYLLDLYNEYGTISGRVLFCLPAGDRDIQIWIVGDVVAIPDLRLSFRKPFDDSTASILSLIRRITKLSASLSAALAATIAIMERVVKQASSHFDCTINLANLTGIAIDRLFLSDDDDLPF